MKSMLIGKPKNSPMDIGEFMVFKYDENDDLVEASSLVFPMRGAAEQFMRDNVDPALDPFVADRMQKETKNGNQESENPYGRSVQGTAQFR